MVIESARDSESKQVELGKVKTLVVKLHRGLSSIFCILIRSQHDWTELKISQRNYKIVPLQYVDRHLTERFQATLFF